MSITSTALQVTMPVTAGNKIPHQTGQTAHDRFWESAENNEITGDHCPKLVLFSLGKLQQYLQEVEKEFDRLGIPTADRGVAVLPVLHEGETRFNVMFAPAVQDELQKVHHIFNESGSDPDPDDPWWWVLGGFNDGHLHP